MEAVTQKGDCHPNGGQPVTQMEDGAVTQRGEYKRNYYKRNYTKENIHVGF